MSDLAERKLWANSGDSHLMEPPDLFASLPDDIKDRLPRSVKDPSGDFETIYIDGQEFRRDLPKGDKPKKGLGINARPTDSQEEDFINRVIGGNDPVARIKDLDNEGVWGEVMYPSLGIWTFNVRTPRVVKEGCRALNDWALEFQQPLTALRLRGLHPPDRHRRRRGRGQAGSRRGASCAASSPPAPLWAGRSGTTRSGTRCGRPSPRRAWSSASTSAPSRTTPRSARASITGAAAGRCSTTWRPPSAASGPPPCWSPPAPWTATPTSRSSSPRAGPPGCPSSPTAWTRATASTASTCGPSCPARPARSSTTRSTPPSSTTSRPWPGQHRHGLQERHVGQRLPPPGRHLRPHPEDAARALRRRGRGSPLPHTRRLPRTVPQRPRTPAD